VAEALDPDFESRCWKDPSGMVDPAEAQIFLGVIRPADGAGTNVLLYCHVRSTGNGMKPDVFAGQMIYAVFLLLVTKHGAAGILGRCHGISSDATSVIDRWWR
jgi:hypothetical protein